MSLPRVKSSWSSKGKKEFYQNLFSCWTSLNCCDIISRLSMIIFDSFFSNIFTKIVGEGITTLVKLSVESCSDIVKCFLTKTKRIKNTN